MSRPAAPDPEVGATYGEWTITGPSHPTRHGRMVPVRCSCGTAGERLRGNILSGKSTCCGCMSRVILPQPGDRVGEWEILRYDGKYHVICRCSCGAESRLYAYSLKTDSRSCGHARKGTRGRSRAKLRRVWELMILRCEFSGYPGYKDYGGRGISVCEEWQSQGTFVEWALRAGYQYQPERRLQLDRIDPDGDYCPENCRWVSPKENARNKRNTVWIEAFGCRKSLPEWLEDPRCSVAYSALWSRIKSGKWTPEGAITTPPHGGVC